MSILMTLLYLGSAASALSQAAPVPQPQLFNVTYYGSGCPEGGGLDAIIGPVNATTSIAPLTFTLSSFTPTLGSFGSGLRMCDIVAYMSVDSGWKVMVNAHGTQAQGYTSLDGNSTLALRGTYQFAEKFETQSIGMLDVDGPLSGQFARRLQPAEGDEGVVSPCMGGELVIEFQSRVVGPESVPFPPRISSNETTWTLSTDIEVSRC